MALGIHHYTNDVDYLFMDLFLEKKNSKSLWKLHRSKKIKS